MNVNRSHAAVLAAVVLAATVALAACAPAPTPVPAPTSAPTSAPTAAAAANPMPTTGPTSAMAPASGGAANSAIKVARIQGFGLFLTDNADRTLYAFDKDTKDASACTDACATNWPPFTADTPPQAVNAPNTSYLDASLLGFIARTDGTKQVTYDGHPLYYYAGDKNPGDVKGHGIGGVWHVLSPRGNPMTNAAPPTSTPFY